MVIFHSYVKLPEGNLVGINEAILVDFRRQLMGNKLGHSTAIPMIFTIHPWIKELVDHLVLKSDLWSRPGPPSALKIAAISWWWTTANDFFNGDINDCINRCYNQPPSAKTKQRSLCFVGVSLGNAWYLLWDVVGLKLNDHRDGLHETMDCTERPDKRHVDTCSCRSFLQIHSYQINLTLYIYLHPSIAIYPYRMFHIFSNYHLVI